MSLSEEDLEAFEALKQACMNSPVLAFTDYTKDFLLETDTSKEGLGAVLSQKQEDKWFHPVAYGSWALTTHGKELPFHKTGVSGVKMGHYRTFQRISAVPTLPGKN